MFLSRIFLIVFSLNFNTLAFAKDACESLPQYTCSGANLNDGTNIVVRNGGTILDEQQDLIHTTQRIQEIFSKSLSFINQFIATQISEVSVQKYLKEKINEVKFEGINCQRYADDSNHSHGSSPQNAFYNYTRNSVRYCGGLNLAGLSDYQLMYVMAHEIAHSIDPCRVADMTETSSFSYSSLTPDLEEFPFKVLWCLRSEKSVYAFEPSTKVEDRGHNEADLQPWQLALLGRSPEAKPFCDKRDQINESFSDWMAAEVLARFMESRTETSRKQHIDGVAGIFRSSCNQVHQLGVSGFDRGYSEHPSTIDRLTKITLAHPKVRELLGCSLLQTDSEIQYCEHKP